MGPRNPVGDPAPDSTTQDNLPPRHAWPLTPVPPASHCSTPLWRMHPRRRMRPSLTTGEHEPPPRHGGLRWMLRRGADAATE
uniref:Uncharacterized protein n=1 Tax=Oryza sativa subsp. japonica TaxID=39947 RepID=Q84ZS0_ORYSJ|nr:hypothetical protein [Oryza sativa Japonica Group]